MKRKPQRPKNSARTPELARLHGRTCTLGEAIGLAIKQHALGNPAAAVATYNLILAQFPRCAEAHNNRGVVLRDLARPDDALAGFEKALALKPAYVDAHNNRGIVLQALGRCIEALASYDRALSLDPGYVKAHNNRGVALRDLGQPLEALASLDRAIQLQPAYAEAHNNRGVALQDLDRHEDALASFNRSLEIAPLYAEAHNNRAVTLQAMMRYQEALADYDQAIALVPNYATAHCNRGISLQETKRCDEALASYDQALALVPNYPAAYNNRGVTLHALKRYGDALASYDRALALAPDYAEAYNNRGVTLLAKGDIPAAEAMFRRAAALKSDYPNPLLNLAGIRKYDSVQHPDVAAIGQLLAGPGAKRRGREFLFFALGKIHDDCGSYDEAFQFYEQANRVMAETVHYDPAAVADFTTQVIETFSRGLLSERASFASSSEAPLFVLGMPRSGTTLVASMLSNHPLIDTAGELPTIIDLTMLLSTLAEPRAPYPRAASQLTPEIAAELIARYEQRLRRDSRPAARHVVDKNPFNFKHLGFIARLFPQARIIHCTRHPLDIGLSNYFQHFAPDNNYSFDLGHIGHFYGQYLRLMEHWRQVLPGRVLEVNYEALIADTEPLARRMLEFVGVEWNPRCLAPHTNRSAVETASNWQVRQPIYQHSVGRWRHYDRHLAPLKAALPPPSGGNW